MKMYFEDKFGQNENMVYNLSYYERQTVTPPCQYSFNSSTSYSTSPEASNTSNDSSYCLFTSPQNSYANLPSTQYRVYSDTPNPYSYYSYSYDYNQFNNDYFPATYNYGLYQPNVINDNEAKSQTTSTKEFDVYSKIANLEIVTNNDTKSKKRRIRTQFSIEQKKYLLTIFRDTIYPSKEQLEIAAQKLCVSMSTVQTWFKNTRSKQKKLCNTKNL